MELRGAHETELDRLARLWYEGWQDAHAAILPADLARLRTLESFRQRLADSLPSVRVAGPPGGPQGFCLVKHDELYQLYVSVQARGSGIAARLIEDAESRLRAAGVRTAWLACAIGNERAARFYEKHGWHRAGVMVNRLETIKGEYLLDVWRYEKALEP